MIMGRKPIDAGPLTRKQLGIELTALEDRLRHDTRCQHEKLREEIRSTFGKLRLEVRDEFAVRVDGMSASSTGVRIVRDQQFNEMMHQLRALQLGGAIGTCFLIALIVLTEFLL